MHISDIDFGTKMALFQEAFSGISLSVAHSPYYILYSVYNTVGWSIASLYNLGRGDIFTLAAG